MNGVLNIQGGWPATAVVKLAARRPLRERGVQEQTGDELLLASVMHPPRSGQTQPIAALMPQVLAQYGLAGANSGGIKPANAVDLLA